MKILFNATTLNKGGALQASINFIEQALTDSEIDWHFAISTHVLDQLNNAIDISYSRDQFTVFEKSPAKNLAFRKKLKTLEQSINPDVVFTLFGPAYVQFHAKHVMGFAEPWVTHANSYALAIEKNLIKKTIRDLHTMYKRRWLSFADAWLVEAAIAKRGIERILNSKESRVCVLPNGCRDIYKTITTRTDFVEEDEILKILYISAYYPHKNFEIIPYVAYKLKEIMPNRPFKFILTINPDNAEVKKIIQTSIKLDVSSSIDFTGEIPVSKGSDLYRDSHIAFIPSLLETYSATYSEAMTCGLPIVTSDLEFATSICEDAALYFLPNNAESAALSISSIATDADLRKRKIRAGKIISEKLPSAKSKYDFSKKFICEIYKAEKKTLPPQQQ